LSETDTRSLEHCLARIRHLEEENKHLRDAALTFGDLAERLKSALDAERRWRQQSAPTVSPRQNTGQGGHDLLL
jgi:hypothetical protein